MQNFFMRMLYGAKNSFLLIRRLRPMPPTYTAVGDARLIRGLLFFLFPKTLVKRRLTRSARLCFS